MCGLVGMAGDLTHQLRTTVFKDMLDVCQTRGRDSTGVIKVNKDLDYTWVKQIGPPNILYDSRLYDNRIDSNKEGEACILVGHTRSKTVGDVNIKNAHPFDFEEEGICGVHNGTLRFYHGLDTYDYKKVDSEVLYGHLAANGPQDTFDRLKGAFACIWWDNNTKCLNFFRNSERPLCLTWSKDLKTMFWASETWMFGTVARKCPLWDGGKEGNQFVELPVNTLWQFEVHPEATGEEKVITMKAPRVIEPEKKPIGAGTTYRGNGSWVETSPGVRQRVVDHSQANGGGSVPRPFAQRHPAVQRLIGEEEEPNLLDDDLPSGLIVTRDGQISSPISKVDFLMNSAHRSDTSTGSTSTKNSKRNILYLPARHSMPSGSSNNEKPSKSSSTSCDKLDPQMRVRRLSQGVSFRTVAGIEYITDNRTSNEYSMQEFFHNTEGMCCFCKTSILDPRQVAAFMSSSKVICLECVEEPTVSVKASAVK